jgi:catechol 2,3-dioxygenase-like lactoylglutathione lyase family enzyme
MMRLRQIALVGADLAAAKAEITQVLGLGADYLDKGVRKFGLVNAVWPVGDTFLEVVSPAEPGTTAGRLMDKRGGDGGYMVILQVDDGLAARARAVGLGVRLVEQAEFKGVVMTHFHPRDVGGAILSVDQMTPPERWEWGGPDWEANVRTEVTTGIVGAELQGPDPEAMATRWGEVLGRPVEFTGEGWRIALDGGELRFVEARDGRGEGLGAFDVAVRDPAAVRAGAARTEGEAVVLCGTRVNLVAA